MVRNGIDHRKFINTNANLSYKNLYNNLEQKKYFLFRSTLDIFNLNTTIEFHPIILQVIEASATKLSNHLRKCPLRQTKTKLNLAYRYEWLIRQSSQDPIKYSVNEVLQWMTLRWINCCCCCCCHFKGRQ